LAFQYKWVEFDIFHVGIMIIIELLKYARIQPSPYQIYSIISFLWNTWKSSNVMVFKNETYNSTKTIIYAKKNRANGNPKKI